MTLRLSAFDMNNNTTGKKRTAFRHMSLVLASLLILVAISGCAGSSTPTPTAQEQLCTNLDNLQSSLTALLDVGSNENMTEFGKKWDQVTADLDDVKTSANEVANVNLDPLTTSFDALVSAVKNALNATSVTEAVASIESAANNFVATVKTTVSNLKCPS